MKTIHKLPACLCLCTILLLACTGESPETDFHAETGTLQVTHAQVLTGMAKTRGDVTYAGGIITVVAYDKPSTYLLLSDGNLNRQGDVLTMPRTSQEAKGLTAYGWVSGTAYGTLPIHAAPASYPVEWSDDHKATISSIKLTPAVAALNITLKNAKGDPLTGFDIITQGKIYQPKPANNSGNWKKDGDGTYQINPDEGTPAIGMEGKDILVAPTDLNHNQSIFEITGRSDHPATPPGYAGKTWTANVPLDLTQLLPGKRYNLTVTLNGERASIAVNNITDWDTGTGNYLPKGYDVALYTWKDLQDYIDNNNGIPANAKIIQMANLDATGKTWSPPEVGDDAIFNGNGYTITGLKAPLFDYVGSNSLIYNVHLRGSGVTDTQGITGLLARQNAGTITLCSATGTLHASTSGSYVGGLVGFNGGSITRSYTDCILTVNVADWVYAGGLVGFNDNPIVACAAWGSVENKRPGNTDAKTGNLVGLNTGSVYYSYATATTGNNMGYGTDVKETDTGDVWTGVLDPDDDLGIALAKRKFIGTSGNWWKPGSPITIDFGYEGTKE